MTAGGGADGALMLSFHTPLPLQVSLLESVGIVGVAQSCVQLPSPSQGSTRSLVSFLVSALCEVEGGRVASLPHLPGEGVAVVLPSLFSPPLLSVS